MLDTTIVGSVVIAATFVVLYAVSSVVLYFKYGAPETETEWVMYEPFTTIIDDGKPHPNMRYRGELIMRTIYVALFIIAMVAICYGVGVVVKMFL
jgi:hypothetical protein